jgi:hypothetical protein
MPGILRSQNPPASTEKGRKTGAIRLLLPAIPQSLPPATGKLCRYPEQAGKATVILRCRPRASMLE